MQKDAPTQDGGDVIRDVNERKLVALAQKMLKALGVARDAGYYFTRQQEHRCAQSALYKKEDRAECVSFPSRAFSASGDEEKIW